ncbi:MAG: TGS domain-containing protein, partial [Flavobacteriales bacterium]
MIKITLPDGSVKEVEKGTSSLDIAMGISEGLARNVLAAEVNGEVVDPQRAIDSDATLTLHTFDSDAGKSTMWHSAAHLMAEALEDLYPGIKLWVGPAIENGFYYDVDFGDISFSEKEFPKVEKRIAELASQKNPFVRTEMSKSEAVAHFEEKGDEYKLDLLERLEDGTITFYTQGGFTDL